MGAALVAYGSDLLPSLGQEAAGTEHFHDAVHLMPDYQMLEMHPVLGLVVLPAVVQEQIDEFQRSRPIDSAGDFSFSF